MRSEVEPFAASRRAVLKGCASTLLTGVGLRAVPVQANELRSASSRPCSEPRTDSHPSGCDVH